MSPFDKISFDKKIVDRIFTDVLENAELHLVYYSQEVCRYFPENRNPKIHKKLSRDPHTERLAVPS